MGTIKIGSTITIPDEAQKNIIKYVMHKFTNINTANTQYRLRLEAIDRSYAMELQRKYPIRVPKCAAEEFAQEADSITVPVVMPNVDACLAYLASVFLTGYPIFGIVAGPHNQEAADMMEASIADHSVKTGWTRQLLMFLRDGLKYNIHGAEVNWEIQEGLELTAAAIGSTEATRVTTQWEGNRIKRMDMYNTVFDTAVAPADIHTHGEFAGYVEPINYAMLRTYLDTDGANFKPMHRAALESRVQTGYYYEPQIVQENYISSGQLNGASEFDWAAFFSGDSKRIKHTSQYEKFVLYARILPGDFGINVPARNRPQIWKFVVINGTTLVEAEPQENAHNYLPIVFGQPLEDGLKHQTKSFAQNTIAYQTMATTLWRSKLASARRRATDRMLYNPSLIAKEDIENPNPSAKIPVKGAGYQSNIGNAVYAIPFHDENSGTFVQEASQISQMAREATGGNAAQQGSFVKGNKTRSEFETVMDKSNGRWQMIAINTEAQTFVPMKEMVKINILQYQPEIKLMNERTQQPVDIKSNVMLEAILKFKVTDGLLPADKIVDVNFLQVLLQAIGSTPMLQNEYDVGGMVAYVASLKGVKDLKDFKRAQPLQQLGPDGKPVQQAALPAPAVPGVA